MAPSGGLDVKRVEAVPEVEAFLECLPKPLIGQERPAVAPRLDADDGDGRLSLPVEPGIALRLGEGPEPFHADAR
jgi:hypothetical protein